MKKALTTSDRIEREQQDEPISAVSTLSVNACLTVNGAVVQIGPSLFDIDIAHILDHAALPSGIRYAREDGGRYRNLTRILMHPEENGEASIKINHRALAAIEHIVGSQPAECGGMLMGNRRNPYVVEEFCFDRGGSCNSGGYDPDYRALNAVLKRVYEPRGMDFLGFVHSHPAGVLRPSGDWGRNLGDLGYCRALLEANPDLHVFLMPIVMTVPDTGRFDIIPYVVRRDAPDRVIEAGIRIID